ncbi:hypothetical protein PL75_04715 [Neisseria arctica]|uniref:Uncharacterized protein n=2 Tax=Neisseria arctica TaxID=1470200 RepID=A0A0J1C4F8_9NEIS|nr:hypothetical protein PL75_04715 [Neisseria arctica]
MLLYLLNFPIGKQRVKYQLFFFVIRNTWRLGMATVIDTLFIELGIDASKFSSEAQKATEKLEKMEKAFDKSEAAAKKNAEQAKKNEVQFKQLEKNIRDLVKAFTSFTSLALGSAMQDTGKDMMDSISEAVTQLNPGMM